MLGPDPRLFGLLPALGLCSCVVAGERETAAPNAGLELGVDRGWIEADSPHRPLTTFEAAVQSARSALAGRHFAAASELLTVALSYEPEAPLLDELRLDQADALIGLGQTQAAREVLGTVGDAGVGEKLEQAVDARIMRAREREHAFGEGPCDVSIEAVPRPLAEHDGFLSVWNELRASLPAAAEIPLPDDNLSASVQLCYGCGVGPNFVSLEHEDASETTWGLLVADVAGELSLMPELLHTHAGSCEDNAELAILRHGDLLWVRAFSDAHELFDPSEWDLGSAVALGSTSSSSGYQSSGYYAGSSGYQSSGYYAGSSGYQSSGYAYYGCGGGYEDDYGYDCVAVSSIERDVFIDLARGEIVLDVVRSGPPSSPLGTVELEQDRVRVEACGVERSLPLSFTQASA